MTISKIALSHHGIGAHVLRGGPNVEKSGGGGGFWFAAILISHSILSF